MDSLDRVGAHRRTSARPTRSPLLDRHLAAQPDDHDARWLLLHALYAQFVRGGKPLPAAEAERFTKHARAYIDAKGANAGLATEWLKAISSS